MATAITGKPTAYPQSVKWTRTGNTMTLNWEYPSSATSETNARRVTGVHTWLYQSKEYAGYYDVFNECKYGISTSTKSRSMTIRNGCQHIEGQVWFYNTKAGENLAEVKLNFTAPPVPTLGSFSYDPEDEHKLSITISAQQAILSRPRRTIEVQVIRDGVNSGKAVAAVTVHSETHIGWDSNTAQYSWTWSITNAAGAWTLDKEDDYFRYRVRARALGVEGGANSAWVEKTYIIASPAHPTIYELDNYSGGVAVYFKDNRTATRPSESDYTLQIGYATKLANVDFDDVGDTFSRPVTSIFLKNEDITPATGEYTWVRVKATSPWSTVYSEPRQLSQKLYFTPAATSKDADTKVIQIESATAGDDNASINAIIGYASDTYTATRISYSTDKDAWRSTKEPDTFDMNDKPWQDDPKQGTHACSTSVKLSELDEGTTYYLRAKRYLASDETNSTNWSQIVSCNTSYADTAGVALTGGDIVATGKDTTFSWTFNEDLKQQSWAIMEGTKGLISGTGSITSCNYAFDTAGDHLVYVACTFDKGRTLTSEPINVTVMDAPVLSFATAPAETVTALPFTFTVNADKADADIQVKILSLGIISNKPDGEIQQYQNDVVAQASGTGKVECSFDDGSQLWNGGVYQIQAVATLNGVTSETLWQNFTVAYTDTVKAPEPEEVTITPTADKGATITVKTLAEGTVWDLYRSTADGRNFKIAQDLEAGATVTDTLAPYKSKGTCEYIVCVRNGQEQFDYREYEYTLNAGTLRFDWNGYSVELPYNITISDESDKQFEQQVYLDGSQRGAWGASVVREASLSTDAVYIKDDETVEKVRELARYQGAVFVRTPLGQAYTANVEVDEISKEYGSNIVAVSFKCTEVDLTTEFGGVSAS